MNEKKEEMREMERKITTSQEYYVESAFHCKNKLPEKTILEGGGFILAQGFRPWILALLL